MIDAVGPGEKGVWRSIARMRRLRTPKIWPDPEFGFAELSFRSWFTRLHGQAAYEGLGRIPAHNLGRVRRLDRAAGATALVSAAARVPVARQHIYRFHGTRTRERSRAAKED